jgi:hypothetical protein
LAAIDCYYSEIKTQVEKSKAAAEGKYDGTGEEDQDQLILAT